MKKLLELKLLNFITFNTKNKMIIELHNIFKGNFLESLKKNLDSNTYINLPNKVFFENSMVTQNNSGDYSKTVQVLSSNSKSKSNWQVIRKMKSNLDNIIFSNDGSSNIGFDFFKANHFLSFISFQHLPIASVSNSSYFFKSKVAFNSFLPLKKSKSKILLTKTKFWIDDFYIGGKDLYSKYSIVMIECSRSFRSESTNFNFIN